MLARVTPRATPPLCLPACPAWCCCRVSRVGPTWIELERPLPYDLRMEWRPAVYTFATPLQHSGFEDFTVKFKWGEWGGRGTVPASSCGVGWEGCVASQHGGFGGLAQRAYRGARPRISKCPLALSADKYPAHMKAYGYNAFWLYGCANSWVRNVRQRGWRAGLVSGIQPMLVPTLPSVHAPRLPGHTARHPFVLLTGANHRQRQRRRGTKLRLHHHEGAGV